MRVGTTLPWFRSAGPVEWPGSVRVDYVRGDAAIVYAQWPYFAGFGAFLLSWGVYLVWGARPVR